MRASFFPLWVKLAIIKTVAGLALGLVTAVILVWLSNRLFPELQEYGEDLGLRVSVYLDRVSGSTGGTLLPKSDTDAFSYLFLDVDPEFGAARPAGAVPESPSEQACAAYAEALRAGRAPATGDASGGRLSCSSARPLNRRLLAALVTELRARKAKMVVLDVVLAKESGVVDRGEDDALTQVLGAAGSAATPVLFAGPYEMYPPSGPDKTGSVGLVLPVLIEDNAEAGIYSAAALPAPGQPVRRYPKCLRQAALNAAPVPSLPYQAALQLRPAGRGCSAPWSDESEGGGNNAPRIIFTLPPNPVHLDDLMAPGRARWGPYRGHYDRCLAANFWDPYASICGQAETYKDKVVVIGVSNPQRRDRHYTPLGDMAGPEVVINAVRSFVAYPEHHDKTLSELLVKKCTIVLWCSVVWFAYFLVRCRYFSEGALPLNSNLQIAGRAAVVGLCFIGTLVAVVVLALTMSFKTEGPVPSLDVMIPVLAIAIDEYVEQVSRIVHGVERRLKWLLGVSPGHG